jgi:hypothetical protein
MGLWLLLLPLFLVLWVVMVLQGKRHYAQAMKKKMGMEFSWLERSHQRDDPERQQQQQKQQQQEQEQQQEASGPRAPASLAGSSAARASEDTSVESASASGAGSQDGADQLDDYAEHLPHMAKGKRGSARRQSIEADVTEVDLQIVTTSEQTSALPGAQHMFHFDASPPRDIAPSGADEADAAGRGDAAEPGKHSSSSTSSGMMHIIDHEGLVESNSRIQEMQKLMVSHMSQLPWRKVDVDTGHYHAHAAIVCRDRRFGEFGKDVLRYCADNLVL